jgi:hypothetical protein
VRLFRPFWILAAAGAAVALAGPAPGPSGPRAGSPKAGRLAELSRKPALWTREEIRRAVQELLSDPARFLRDSAYRDRRANVIARALPKGTPADLRTLLLYELARSPGMSFDDLERIEAAWKAIPRESAGRRAEFDAGRWIFPRDSGGRIEASLYSLNSDFFDPLPVARFLAAVRSAAPDRTIVVLTDPLLAGEIGTEARRLNVDLLRTYQSGYTPWPRDTFTFLRSPGHVFVLVRPDAPLQRNRRVDNLMGRELIDQIPPAIDRAWGSPHWGVSPVPFHNGQVLLTRGTAWISLHSLEPRILELLGLDRVPVETFSKPEGIRRYIGAARRAAAELESLYGRSVRFVHPLPGGPGGDEPRLMTEIGGGAGFDLDSIVTFLDGDRGNSVAMVASVAEGRRLLQSASEGDLAELGNTFGLAPEPAGIRRALLENAGSARSDRLETFLDLVARNLKAQGVEVHRLPAVLVPYSLLQDAKGLAPDGDFLLTWDNVVIESDGGLRRAEGFSGGIPAGDREARETFAAAGYRLDLYPPLVHSIVLNGGYRCASNHLRLDGNSRRQ